MSVGSGVQRSPPFRATAATTMNSTMGMIFAKVVAVLSAAAPLMPRSTRIWTLHSSTEAEAMATGVVPSPKTGKN